MPLSEGKTHWTFADYLYREEPERMEIINGEAVMMAGASSAHQEISMEISRQLANCLDGKPCKVYAAPYDVRLFEKNGDKPENVDTVVQPNISVVCDKSKTDNRGCKGAPDFVIEILSPSTTRQDHLVKFNLYQQAGSANIGSSTRQAVPFRYFPPTTTEFFGSSNHTTETALPK